jgi:hypothetical protein
MTIETLFGGQAAAKVLLFIENYGEGYASAIARTFEMPVSEVQKQLKKFEQAGILVRRPVATSRMYTWNPRDPALNGLRQLLKSTLDYGIPAGPTREILSAASTTEAQGKATIDD